MLSFSSSRRIFLARAQTDMRKGIDGLVSLVMSSLGEEPRSGDCFVFMGRDRRRLKVLAWDEGGYWLCAKRLEVGTFALPTVSEEDTTVRVVMSPAQMHLLLAGIDVRDARYRKRARR
jgi:transposase